MTIFTATSAFLNEADPFRAIDRVPLVTPHNPRLRALLLKPEPLTADEWAYLEQCEREAGE